MKARIGRRGADETIRRANAAGFQAQAEAYCNKIQSERVFGTPPCSDCSRMGNSCKKLPVIGEICGECYKGTKCERCNTTHLDDPCGRKNWAPWSDTLVIHSLQDAQKLRRDIVDSWFHQQELQ